jgi:hypothetical protein
MPNYLHMKNMPTCNLYMVSAMGMVGLLWWNIGNDNHFREFHFEKHLTTYRELSGRLVPFHERMQNVSNYNVEMMMPWQQCSKAQVQVHADFPGQIQV